MDNNDFQEAVGVVIYTSPELQKLPHMREVLYGLEEEEIPFFVRHKIIQSHDMVSHAFQAAAQSALGVGICFAQNCIIIHHQNLKRKEPLFYMGAALMKQV